MSEQMPSKVVSTEKPIQWVLPAFEDFTTVHSNASCSHTKSIKRSVSAAFGKQDISSSEDKITKRRDSVFDSELWAEKFSPQSQSDLAVHKRKISEIEAWLKSKLFVPQEKASVLLLTGPTGAGKTAALKLVSRELMCELKEWINPLPSSISSWAADSHQNYSHIEEITYESESKKFQDFLLRANRYNTLNIFEDSAYRKKIILVEDFPNVFYKNFTEFHEILRKYVHTGKTPLVIIVSDSTSSNSSERLLFPKSFQDQLRMDHIRFNPITVTVMMKVLSRIALLESTQGVHKFPVPTKSIIESIAVSSNGDIRAAVNTLQFVCLKDTSDLSQCSLQKKHSLSKSKTTSMTYSKSKALSKMEIKTINNSQLASIGGRDASLFLFRALGKILYCKREELPDNLDCPSLPPHLAEHERDALLEIPENVVEKSYISGDYFTAYLHQNYIDFYNDIDDLVRATEYFSDADFISTNWANKSVLQEYAVSVATRGVMHSNRVRCRSGDLNIGWRPLHKPQWYETLHKARERCQIAKEFFKGQGWTSVILQTELIPYMSLTNVKLQTPGHIAFLQDLTHFPSSSNRYNLERLGESDVTKEDHEGETKNKSSVQLQDFSCTQYSLLTKDDEDEMLSNSQSNVSQVSKDDVEVVIEEFDD